MSHRSCCTSSSNLPPWYPNEPIPTILLQVFGSSISKNSIKTLLPHIQNLREYRSDAITNPRLISIRRPKMHSTILSRSVVSGSTRTSPRRKLTASQTHTCRNTRTGLGRHCQRWKVTTQTSITKKVSSENDQRH